MLDKASLEGVGELIHLLQKQFNLPTYELVKITEKVFPGRPWRKRLEIEREKDEKLLREIFGWEEGDGEIEG